MSLDTKVEIASHAAAYAAMYTLGFAIRSVVPVPMPAIQRAAVAVGTAAITTTTYHPVRRAVRREIKNFVR